jgi:hypothetical protein
MLENKDGITHINIYSQGKTELGRFLSNFTRVSVETEDGHFESIEGYWYWLTSEDDNLRKLYGFQAKKYGREIGAQDWDDSDWFKDKIKKAIIEKIRSIPEMHYEFMINKLPFDHYYVYNGKIRRPKECKWLIDWFNNLDILEIEYECSLPRS